MREWLWNVLRLLVIAGIALAFGLSLGVRWGILFAALFSVGGVIAVLREWREYALDTRPQSMREGDGWTFVYAVEVFAGWPIPSVMAFLGMFFDFG